MINETTPMKSFTDSSSHEDLDLLQALLQADSSYPWNPAAPESEAYFTAIEDKFTFDSWLDEEIEARSHNLFNQLDNLWEISSPSAVVENYQIQELLAVLAEKFSPRVPAIWLDKIAHQAYQLLSTNLSFADRLVNCVQEVLPSWSEEDLQVIARPYAWAMRSVEVSNTNSADWQDLSELEQARLSLAIATFAFSQLNKDNYSKE